MITVSDHLKKFVEQNNYVRERFEQRKIPTDFSNITVMSVFGDIKGMCVLSALLLQRYREECKNSKYFILLSWPGFQSLFPYVDEYWSISEESNLKKFYEQSEGLKNKSDFSTVVTRNLNEAFRDVINEKEVLPFYKNGLTNSFFEKFTTTKRFMPFVPSSSILGKEFNRQLNIKSGYKVLIHPSVFVKQWKNGKSENVKAKKEFWTNLVDYLIKNDYCPVIWQNYLSYDISQEFVDRCVFVNDSNILNILATMRTVGCVLDVFNGISGFATLARCPFLAVNERSHFVNLKEYEFNDLCGFNLPKEYIFTFSTIITEGNSAGWNHDIFPTILNKLNNFIPSLNRDEWPTTGETSEIVSYNTLVKKQEQKKIGMKFIRVEKI